MMSQLQIRRCVRFISPHQIKRQKSTAQIKPFQSIPGPRSLPLIGHAHLFTPIDIPRDCIWNIDETALFYRTTSSRSYVTVNSDGRGVKRSKERVTVTLIVNAVGEKLNVHVIGKSKAPRALKGPYSLSRMVNAHEDLYRRFGAIVKFHLGIKMILLYNPDDASKLFLNDEKQPKRPLFEALRKYRESKPEVYKRSGLVTENGPDWLYLRKIANWILIPSNPPLFLHRQSEVADDFVHYVERSLGNQGLISDFLPLAMRYTQEAIGIVCFSERLGCLDKGSLQAESMVKAVEESLDVMGRTLLGFPWWRIIKTPLYRKLEKSQDFIQNIVERHLIPALHRLESDPSAENHFLRHLQSATLDKRDAFLIVNEFFQAGIEATASVITWMFYHLGRNQQVQEKLYEEIRPLGSIKNIEGLPYLTACLKETLRLTPTALGSARILSRDIIISGYHIPADTLIVACHPVMSRLPEYFPNPEEFRPERFIRLKSNRKPVPFATLPFGFGMRMCPGQRLAEQEIKLCVIKILSKYRVEYVGEEAGLVMRLNLISDRKLAFRFHERN